MICPICQSGVPYPPCRSSYCEGHADGEWEGRQAAIRSEIAWHIRWCERRWSDLNFQAMHFDACDIRRASLDRAMADVDREVADCRRWLQETA